MDWVEFLDRHHIYYVTSGPNTSRGQISLQCPWCGVDDHSQHLSVNLNGKGFRCWRNPRQHSGKNPAKLIQALLGCSWEQASRLAGNERSVPDDFLNKLKSKFFKTEEVEEKRPELRLPSEFKRFSGLPSARPYIAYLHDRGFLDRDISRSKGYDVYYASRGLYKGRIIFVVREYGEIVGWTGRTIYKDQMVRYKTLTHDLEKASERGEIPAPNPISHYLLFHDRLLYTPAHTIVLCEGPFDAWRVNLLGEVHGIVATCFFTSSCSEQQAGLLHSILPKFQNKYLLLDRNTFSKSQRLLSDLTTLSVSSRKLPPELKDPGEIQTSRELLRILQL